MISAIRISACTAFTPIPKSLAVNSSQASAVIKAPLDHLPFLVLSQKNSEDASAALVPLDRSRVRICRSIVKFAIKCQITASGFSTKFYLRTWTGIIPGYDIRIEGRVENEPLIKSPECT
jgi:hypothetical protein